MNLPAISELLQMEWFSSFLPSTPIALVIFLIQSTLFLSLILVVDHLMREKPASLRKFLWFWSIMLVPLITIVANLSPVNRVDQYFAAAIELPLFEFLIISEESEISSVVLVENTTAMGTNEGGAGSTTGAFTNSRLWEVMVFIYGVIAILLLARIPFWFRAMSNLQLNSTRVGSKREKEAFTRVAQLLNYNGQCSIKLSDKIESPISFGIFSPVILFPAKYHEQLSDAELYTILLHELSHIRNSDPLKLLLLKVVESIFFFQPLIWLAVERVRYLSELVADDSVIEAGVEAETYANAIANYIERSINSSRSHSLSSGIFSSSKTTLSRIERILDDRSQRSTQLESFGLAASVLLLSAILLFTAQVTPRSSALGISSPQSSYAENSDREYTTQLFAENSEEIYLELDVDKSTVAVGEQVELSIKLFYTINGIRNPVFTELLMPNSVQQSIKSPKQYELLIEGVRFGVYEKGYTLIPESSGPIEIPNIRFTGEVVDGYDPAREVSASVEGLTIEVTESE